VHIEYEADLMTLSGYKKNSDETWYWGICITRIHLNLILFCVDTKNVQCLHVV
jgi:hypothetical protein